MNKIKQVKNYINPTSPFEIRYNYEIDVNMDLDEVPEKYRDFIFEQLLFDFELELRSKIYKIDEKTGVIKLPKRKLEIPTDYYL